MKVTLSFRCYSVNHECSAILQRLTIKQPATATNFWFCEGFAKVLRSKRVNIIRAALVIYARLAVVKPINKSVTSLNTGNLKIIKKLKILVVVGFYMLVTEAKISNTANRIDIRNIRRL